MRLAQPNEHRLRTLKVATQSLFVLEDNQRAKRLYERLGFTETSYPGSDIHMAGILYMTRTAQA